MAYCPNCGTETSENSENSVNSNLTDKKRLIGTWIYVDSWGNFTYTFYSDGSCYGQYSGDTFYVYPSLFPYLDSEGSGQGHWSIVDNKLKIEYKGKYEGVQYYDYLFNEDHSQLTVDALNTSRPPVKWIRYPENSNIDAYGNGKLIIKGKDDKTEVSGFGLINEAEINVEDEVYWISIEFNDYGLKQFNNFRSAYSGTFIYELWVEDEHLITLSSEGLMESDTMSFPCGNYESAQITAYKLNQTANSLIRETE